MKQTTKSGFTLVELSIVLVIIGLLIGGILVGQSLIESAKMQSFIRQVGQYDAAVGVFKDKFGNLPGDNALFGTIMTSGGVLGDGQITDDLGTLVKFSSEIGGFWPDLSASGLKSEDTSSTFTASRTATGTAPTLGTYIPQAKVGTNAGIYAYGVGGKNYFYVAAASASGTTLALGAGSLKPADGLAIDGKIDDGVPSTGNVVAVGVALTTFPAAADYTTPATNLDGTPSATECYLTTTTYNAAVANDYCKLSIRMGASTGVVQ